MTTSLRQAVVRVKELLEALVIEQDIDAKVYYGDQAKLEYPIMLCVEPESKRREISGTHQYRVEIRVNIIIYQSFLRSADSNREDADLLAEIVEDMLDLNPKLDGLFTHFMVEEQNVNDSLAYADTPVRGTRLNCIGTYKEIMPNV